MSQSLSDYFALEAGEYLEQLDALLGGAGTPDFDRLFRLARGVRGSARMADEQAIAAVAERLEGAGRALYEGRVSWSEELRARAIRTVDDLKVLVRARGSWGAAEEARAREAAARWEGIGVERGGEAAPADGAERLLPFLRREVMGVVSELDHAGETLRRDPEEREALRAVVLRMRPLRGVTGVAALAPVQEVLEGVEDAVQQLLNRSASVAEAHLRLLGEARAALQGALLALERGEAAGGEALERFRDARERLAEGAEPAEEEGVLPVAALFHDDAGPHVVSSPLAPAQGEEGSSAQVERFLRLEATGFLDRAEALIAGSPPGRERSFGRVAAQLSRLARAVEELAGTYGIAAVREAAERAGTELRGAAAADEARAALSRLRASLPGAEASAAPAPAPQEPPAAEPVVEPERAEDGVIPVESLLLRGEAALREALALRPEVERLAAGAGAAGGLREKLAELFDLVALGLEEPTPS